MTTPTMPADERSTSSREAKIAEEVRLAVDQLNTAISRAAEFGLRIEVDVMHMQHVSRQWSTPVLSVQLTRKV